MIQDNMDFLDEEEYDGPAYNLDSDESVEFILVPAWRMNNGNLIAIKNMNTSHIKNCIKMIYKSNGRWRRKYLSYFERELRRRKYI